jgi:hypothetical protein
MERIVMFDGLRKFWKEIVTEYRKPDHDEELPPAEKDGEIPKWAREPEPDTPASLTITQNFNDDGFEPIRAWLQADSRVAAESTDNGRHYSVPDGDDLPEWYAIRISTTYKQRESLKEDLQKMIDTDLQGRFKVEYY